MAGSLQDQFLAAGLIKKQKAKNIQTAKKKAKKQSRANNTELVDEAGELAKQAQQEQRNKSQSLNKQHKVEADKKAELAQIRQIITLNSIAKAKAGNAADDLVSYNFTHNNKIKTLYVSFENHDLIIRGVVAIACLEQSKELSKEQGFDYHLIPAVAAEKINQRDSESVVLLNDFLPKDSAGKERTGQEGDEGSDNTQEDDPYSGFEVPDDLLW